MEELAGQCHLRAAGTCKHGIALHTGMFHNTDSTSTAASCGRLHIHCALMRLNGKAIECLSSVDRN